MEQRFDVESELQEVKNEIAQLKAALAATQQEIEAATAKRDRATGEEKQDARDDLARLADDKKGIRAELVKLRGRAEQLEIQRTEMLRRPSAQGSSFFQVNGTLRGSRSHKGVRMAVYKFAEDHGGFYPPGEVQKSIFYDPTSPGDLSIRLLFESIANGNRFCGRLFEFCRERGWRELVTDENENSNVKVRTQPTAVPPDRVEPVNVADYFRDRAAERQEESYDADQMSPECDSVTTSISLVSVQHDPENQLQMLEDPGCLARLRLPKAYKCHIAPKCMKIHDKSASNLLNLSWQFHQYLDGLNSDAPLMSVRCAADLGDEIVELPRGRVRKRKLEVEIEWVDDDVAEGFEQQLKQTARRAEGRSNMWRVPISVDDGEITKQCLQIKYEDTVQQWRMRGLRGTELTGEEIAELTREP